MIVLSVMSGFENDLKHKILGTNAHIVVTRARDQPFTDYARAARRSSPRSRGVIGATPYMTNEVMISSQSNLSGVVVKGIDPATVGQVTDLVKNTDVGRARLPDRARRSCVGAAARRCSTTTRSAEAAKDAPKDAVEEGRRREARRRQCKFEAAAIACRASSSAASWPRTCALYLGDDVNIVSPFGGIGPSGAIPKSKPFRVAGIFFSGMFEYDTKYVYIALPAAQKFFTMADEVTGIELKVADPDRTEPVARRAHGASPAPATRCRTGSSSTAASSRRSRSRRS